MLSLLLVLGCVILVATGQLLLKYGMLRIGSIVLNLEQLPMFLGKAFSSPFIICGFGLYLISSLVWLVIISREELSRVYPLMALVYIFVVFFSWLLFKEDVGLVRILGVLAIALGVFLVARS